jgi:C-terminal processing protease CtpA/Prc
MSFCSKGIKKISFYFFSENSRIWYYKTFDFKNDDYNSVFLKLNNLSQLDTSNRKPILNKRIFNISKIYLIIEPVNKHFNITFGELLIANFKETQHTFYHPFFDAICENNSLLKIKENSITFKPITPFLITPISIYGSAGSPNYYLINPDSLYDKINIFHSIINQIINNYPFYKEKNLNIEAIRDRINIIFNSKLNYPCIVDSISYILNTFGDPHLYIENDLTLKRPKKPTAPISIYEIADKLYISAVFDTALNKLINIEDEVVEIDNMSIQKRIDSISFICKGSYFLKRKKALERLLNTDNGDSIKIRFVNKFSDTLALYVKFKNNVEIPINFRPTPCEFKKVAKDINYFYFDQFDNNSICRFFNSVASLDKTKSIIIDIRNNGGGNGGSVINLLSTFIKSPCTLYNSNLPQFDVSKESLVIYPDKHFRLDFKSIVILINSRTTCGSELFALAMKEHVGAIIVGDNNTGGAFANMHILTFPDNLKIHFNCLSKETFNNYGSIENIGIKPDVYVWNNRISDLYPYNDKVLKTAIKILQNQ